MRRFSISELDARAPELALGRGLGLEIIGFCTAERMEDAELLASEEVRLRPFARKSLHAPYYELTPCAIDSLIGRVSLHRYRQAVQTCMRLGVRRMVVHSGFAPQMYFPEWFVPKSIEFWKGFVRELPEDFELLLENVLDVRPEYIRDVCDGVNDPRLRLCLDVGHANAYSEVSVEDWISMLGGRIAHVHLHNNDGSRDAHAPLNAGSMDIAHILELLDAHAPEAEICIESVDALSCLKTLEETGAMEKIMNPYEIDIPALDEKVMKEAWARQDALAKPPRSLGVLEEISVRFAGMTGKLFNDAKKRRILVFAADNGVVEEGVTSAPQSVTLAQTINFTRGLTGVAVLAKHYNTELKVVDVGVNARFEQPGVIDRKIAMGTRNLAKEPAMTREQALRALNTGFEMAAQAAEDGVEILGVGEMGIGNTTTSSAILSCLLNLPAEETTGRGGGVNDAGFARKKEIIDSAIARWRPDPADVVDVLSKVGGFDVAAMCGAFLGAAANRLPVVIDGYISAVAALCAYRIRPASSNYFFGSHISCERGYLLAMNEMGVKPMFQLEMRLGEGSGCPIAFEVIDGALSVLKNMATFDEARIDDGYLNEIRSDAHLQR